MPRALLLRAADKLIEPGPVTVALHRTIALVFIDVALTGFRWGRRLWND